MRHDLDIYISSRISGLEENGWLRGLDKISAGRRFLGFCGLEGVCSETFSNLKDQDTSVTWPQPGLPSKLHYMSSKGTGSKKGSYVATSAEKPKSAMAAL